MVAAGRTLHWGYFDHPPLAWWLSAGIAKLTGSEAAIVVRLPFIALFAASTWMMARLTAELYAPAAGWWAAAALNLAPVLGVTTGSWVLPDGPLIASLLAAAFCFVRALGLSPIRHSGAEPAPDLIRGRNPLFPWSWWLGAGAAAGCALLSKYSAALVLLGAVIYLLTERQHRPWLARPQPYVAAAIALLLFAPVVLWNAHHGWASFAFQGERATAYRFNPLGLIASFGGTALYLLPWIWLPLILAFARGLRAGPADAKRWLLCCLAAPPVLLFPLIALWSRAGQFHWAVPGYLFLFPLLGERLVRWSPAWSRAWLRASAALVCAGLVAVAAEARWNWIGPLGRDDDPGLQAIDGTPLRAALQARGLLNTPIGALNWPDAGKIGYALGGDPPVLCLNPDAREFRFAQETRPVGDVLIIVPGHASVEPTLFETVTTLPPLRVDLPGRTVNFSLFVGKNLRRWPP
jgi:4-amino-4-deoxy-L-arabinose transferase-like glycosyltransferase